MPIGSRAAAPGSGGGAAGSVFEADDVVEVGRRDLEDERVLERGDAVHRPRPDAERRARTDDLRTRYRIARRAHLDLGSALEGVPRLVLLVVELEAQRLVGSHEEKLADVRLRVGP